MFEVRWEFDVRPEHRDEFADVYGPAGEWVRLFKTGAGFLGTELEQIGPTRWRTVDRWESRASYAAFRTAQATAYAALDERCANFTRAERNLGERGD